MIALIAFICFIVGVIFSIIDYKFAITPYGSLSSLLGLFLLSLLLFFYFAML